MRSKSEDPSVWVELQNFTILTGNNPVEERFKTQWAFRKAAAKERVGPENQLLFNLECPLLPENG